MGAWNDAGNWIDEQISSLTGASEARAKKAEQQALAQKLAKMQQAKAVFGQYRPEMMNARMNALRNRMSAFQGANNAMATMYGKQNAPGFNQLLQNPMSATMPYQGNKDIPGDHPMQGVLQNYQSQVGDQHNPNAQKQGYVEPEGPLKRAEAHARAKSPRWGGG